MLKATCGSGNSTRPGEGLAIEARAFGNGHLEGTTGLFDSTLHDYELI